MSLSRLFGWDPSCLSKIFVGKSYAMSAGNKQLDTVNNHYGYSLTTV